MMVSHSLMGHAHCERELKQYLNSLRIVDDTNRDDIHEVFKIHLR